MRLLFLKLLPVLLLSLTANAQQRKLVLRIDTLVLNGSSFEVATGNHPSFPLFWESIPDSLYSFNRADNSFSCSLVLEKDSSVITITLDNEGGYLLLRNSYSIPEDTLTISRHTLVLNCYTDTVFTQTTTWLVNKDESLGEITGADTYCKIIEEHCIDTPVSERVYSINGMDYRVPVQKMLADGYGDIVSFHGRKDRKKIALPGSKRSKAYYFHGTATTHHYIHVITLDLLK